MNNFGKTVFDSFEKNLLQPKNLEASSLPPRPKYQIVVPWEQFKFTMNKRY